MKLLLTYPEFKEIADFIDKNASDKFQKYLKQTEQTYLKDLIGSDLVAKLKEGDYPDLLPFVKNCLSYKIEIKFVEVAPVTVTGEGGLSRTSDYAKQQEFVDKQNLLKSLYETLRSYELSLISEIKEQEIEEWNENNKISSSYFLKITSIGD